VIDADGAAVRSDRRRRRRASNSSRSTSPPSRRGAISPSRARPALRGIAAGPLSSSGGLAGGCVALAPVPHHSTMPILLLVSEAGGEAAAAAPGGASAR
jgi:hypothetical protein